MSLQRPGSARTCVRTLPAAIPDRPANNGCCHAIRCHVRRHPVRAGSAGDGKACGAAAHQGSSPRPRLGCASRCSRRRASLQPRWPWLGFVAAFAEAATIGGLADWYAVVALFRRPLGLPIPHTAIIPANQNRIADNLGRFIEVNFLAPEPVRAKLAEVDFAALVADWLADPGRAGGLVRLRRPAGAADDVGDRGVRPARLHHPARARPARQGACRAARRRTAHRLHRRPPPPKAVRRADRRAWQIPQRRGGARRHARKDPRRAAVAVQSVPRRRLSAEEDRRVGRHAVRRGAGRRRTIRCGTSSTASSSASSSNCAIRPNTPSAPKS